MVQPYVKQLLTSPTETIKEQIQCHSSKLRSFIIKLHFIIHWFLISLLLLSSEFPAYSAISFKLFIVDITISICCIIRTLLSLVLPTLSISKPTTCIHCIVIGVNRPAIVREIPHFGLFPAFPHFFENVPHFWLYFEITKFAENRTNFSCMRHFVRKISAKTSKCVT